MTAQYLFEIFEEIVVYINSYPSKLSLFVSLIALLVGFINFRRKSGVDIKGDFGIASSINAEDKYISGVVLENFKDKPVIIYKLFLRVGENNYIELKNFEDEPKILKPYESYAESYQPVDFYCTNNKRINLNNILSEKGVKMCLVLSTHHGKYVVKKPIKYWDPIFDGFKNPLISYIQPMRPVEISGYYGYEVRYIVKFATKNGSKNVVPVYSGDFDFPRFKSFRLTRESLFSKETLEVFLVEQVNKGSFDCVRFDVLDAKELRNKSYGGGYGVEVKAKCYNWFQFFFIGKIYYFLTKIRC